MISRIYVFQVLNSLEELQDHDRDKHLEEEIPIVTMVISVG